MKKSVLVITGIFILCLILLLSVIGIYKYSLSSLNKEKSNVMFEVKSNSTVSSVISDLAQKKIIKSKIVTKIYVKLNNIDNVKSGTYELNDSYSTKEILELLKKGNNYNLDEITITFKEGINIKKIAKLISEKTNNTESEILNLVKDKEYLNELINTYWFITDDILNKNIYYPLEGYLFADTYNIYKTSNVKFIFKKMLDKMDEVLTVYKTDIQNQKFSVHEFLTLSSIVQLEGTNDKDMEKIAGVFYNRLKTNMSFGSCVTACYGGNEDDCIPSKVPTKDINPYNTYLDSMAGKLPIGPIGNVGKIAIKSTIFPENHNNYYFISDKNMKTYFFKTYNEHINKQRELINSNMYLGS